MKPRRSVDQAIWALIRHGDLRQQRLDQLLLALRSGLPCERPMPWARSRRLQCKVLIHEGFAVSKHCLPQLGKLAVLI